MEIISDSSKTDYEELRKAFTDFVEDMVLRNVAEKAPDIIPGDDIGTGSGEQRTFFQ